MRWHIGVRRSESGIGHALLIASIAVIVLASIYYFAAGRDGSDTRRAAPAPGIRPTATLGVSVGAAPGGRGPGVVVTAANAGGPAAAAGITTNAVIVSVGEVSTPTPRDLGLALSSHAPGDIVPVDWADTGGVFHTSSIRLASARPA
jgi:S1-C subfamily serine protease